MVRLEEPCGTLKMNWKKSQMQSSGRNWAHSSYVISVKYSGYQLQCPNSQ